MENIITKEIIYLKFYLTKYISNGLQWFMYTSILEEKKHVKIDMYLTSEVEYRT